jgi:DNA-binding MurR/RpiR family transcriptional regulator
MIYDRLPVALLSLLSVEDHAAVNAQIARYLLEHAGDAGGLSVKAIATACHVGTGTVSRFAKDAGFESFAALREAFAEVSNGFERVEGADGRERTADLARAIGTSVAQVATSVDHAALARLVADLHAYEQIGVYGLLKAQAAAIDLQVDLLMLGKLADTCTSAADQARRITGAGAAKLVVVFSYTGTYFDAVEIGSALRRVDRPKVWVVCGNDRPLPSFVADRVLFSSSHSQLGHPYQLEYVAGLIAQEFAASL